MATGQQTVFMLEKGYLHQNGIELAQAALHAPPEVSLQCIAGHCYYQLSLFFFFGPGVFACATRGGVSMHSWSLLTQLFSCGVAKREKRKSESW